MTAMRSGSKKRFERVSSASQEAGRRDGGVSPGHQQSAGNQSQTEAQLANEASPSDSLHELQQDAGNQALVSLLSTGVVQRKAKGDSAETGAGAGSQSETEQANQKSPAAASALIVEDDAREVTPGQMRKSDFLSQLRTAATSAAETALAGTMWSAMGCPYIDRWLGHYSKQPSAYLERALRKYVPEAASVRSAQEYIPLVQQRLRRGIEEWRSTGEVKDLPPEFAAGGMPGMTAQGLLGGLIGGAVSAIGGAISSAVSGIGSALSSVGSMLFKRHEGAETETTEDPAAVRAQLGGGQALDSSTQRRMQSAFGVDFAGVRVHTDTRARELTEGMQARAFTIGSDIAFGGEEYKPGTPVGDALIAHELAHVVQQGGGQAGGGAQHKGGELGSLEEDADRSAVGAVVKLWSGARGDLSQLGQKAAPSLRSGLRLQRCGGSPKKTETTTPATPTTQTGMAIPANWAKDVNTANPEDESKPKDEAMMLALVKKALEPKYTVALVGDPSAAQEEAKDYQKAPVINFVPNMNTKKKHKQNAVMTNNAGHSFDEGNDIFASIGPKALKPSSPLVTVMLAEHELYHTTHHLGPAKPRPKPGEKGPSDADEETETYTNDFVNYFALLGAVVPGPDRSPRYIGETHGQLLNSYPSAKPEVQKAALKRLVDYYQKPPTSISGGIKHHPTNAAEVQEAFKLWLSRRDQSNKLVVDLKAALKI
jgi:uncharacterized protein DUF4157